ncbi:MAG: calcium-binding protein [Nocardioidaceae bacterium]
MTPTSPRLLAFVAAVATAALALPTSTALASPSADKGAASFPQTTGKHPRTEIMWNNVVPLKNQSQIVVDEWGLRYMSGQQNSHLTITYTDSGQLLFTDTGTASWRRLPAECAKHKVNVGIEALCDVPAAFVDAHTMFVEVWPRLGNDWVDGSSLPAKFRLWALVDKGRDTVYGGAGDDFANGYKGVDRFYGGPGDDWFRGGLDEDVLVGDAGNDYLVSTDQDDDLDGGPGADGLYCGNGRDTATTDSSDIVRFCEVVH